MAEVLRRKLHVVTRRYQKSQLEWERYAVLAVSSLYGIDILADNTQECQNRLFDLFNHHYTQLFRQDCKPVCLNSVRFLLRKNIIWGDALSFTQPDTGQSIIFSEWSAVNGWMLKRRDYAFSHLVEKITTQQAPLFNDAQQPVHLDEPVADFPLIHFLKLGEDAINEL